MFRKVRGLFGCVRGKHCRSLSKVRKSGKDVVSVCEHCGVRMRRLAKRRWIVERQSEPVSGAVH